ncbi:MAG TPA: hypothetical protein VJV03_08515 [Pyrinomonadaceae bacterium]|nr:hypothetical protein [Pyrinomonadaceae bacterium]
MAHTDHPGLNMFCWRNLKNQYARDLLDDRLGGQIVRLVIIATSSAVDG